MITIFTPTYNRANLLPRLYESLCRQTCRDFEWLIVDDGSSDNTSDIVEEWRSRDNGFPIRYIAQKNQGKHIAINTGMEQARGEWFLVVDSDDYLSDDAIVTIRRRTLEIEPKKELCGVTMLRIYQSGATVGGEMKSEEDILSDYFSYRHIEHINGDRAEVFRTSYLRKYPFPKFEGEKFMTESVLCYRMACDYKTLFTCDRIYICEYQPGGLTSDSFRLYRNNPLGSMLNALTAYRHPACSFRYKLRYAGYYLHFRKLAQKKYSGAVPDIVKGNPVIMLEGAVASILRKIKNFGKDPLKK